MNQFYVVIRTKERDKLLDVVKAMEVEDAVAIAKVRYEGIMNEREGLFIFPANELLSFNEKNRFARNSDGEMRVIIKL